MAEPGSIGVVHVRLRPEEHRGPESRIWLRSLVSELAEVPVEQVRIDHTCPTCAKQHGRPRVVEPEAARVWQVSLAHAGSLVALAATTAGPVGVDLELVSGVGFEGFDDVALTSGEREWVAAAGSEAEAMRRRAVAWVRKEALLKATGQGLRVDPRSVEVGAVDRPEGMQVLDVPAPEGWASAVVVLTDADCRLDLS